MKTLNIIFGAIIFLMVACTENNNRIEGTTTKSNETTLNETVTSGGKTDEPITSNMHEPATTETNIGDKLVKVVLPQFENADIEYYEAENYSIYSLGKASLFVTGSASLRSGAEQSLEKISTTLTQFNKDGQIMLYGYIDASENPNFKTDISERRLKTIKEWLQNQGNIEASRLTVQPIVNVASPAASDLDREKEKRIEIIVKSSNK